MPTLEEVRIAIARFGDAGSPPLAFDLRRRAHRAALHRWLNSWGCRIAYARDGEPDPFDRGIAGWWRRASTALAGIDEPLADLTDDHVDAIATSFGSLSATAVGARRTMGPTAAAKALYALRPRTVMPWDLAIAEQLHRGRDAAAFAAHLRLGRRWANELLAESGLGDEAALLASLGRPTATLAKLLDEYCYVRFTAGA